MIVHVIRKVFFFHGCTKYTNFTFSIKSSGNLYFAGNVASCITDVNVSGSSGKGQVKFWKQAKLSVIIFFLMPSNFGRALLLGAPTARCKLVLLPGLGILTCDNLLNGTIKNTRKQN